MSVTSLDSLPDLAGDYVVSAAQTTAFRRDGHVLLRGVLSPGEVEVYRQVILDDVATRNLNLPSLSQRDDYGKMFVQTMHLWESNPAIARLSLSRRLGKLVADLMAADVVRIYHDQTLCKEPGGTATPWHQDGQYVPLDKEVVTLWMPLVDVSAQMGTMRFASGSHARGMLLNQGTSEETGERYAKLIAENDWAVTESGDMAAGDVTVHNSWTIHAVPGNAGDRRREVLTILYYPDGTRVTDVGFWEGASKAHMNGRKPGELADSEINPIVYRR